MRDCGIVSRDGPEARLATRSYWLNLFTVATWEEFLSAGGAITGFREGRWSRVQKVAIGDYFLCYLTGASRFIAVLEATRAPYRDPKRDIWSGEDFPCRVPVRIVTQLTPDTGVPVRDLDAELSMFRNMKSSLAWTGAFRGSPTRWSEEDGTAVVRAIEEAIAHPINRPLDRRKATYRPTLPRGSKRVREPRPEFLPEPEGPEPASPEVVHEEVQPREARAHTEIQWRLLRLGGAMQLDVWVARNDRSAVYQGERLGDMPRMRQELPRQFEDRTTRLIELIDVLWLSGDSIVAAFEIESTTSIYSGLLRMSDLIALQPNLNIPLYLVAPDERRAKVAFELTRPTFNRLHPPLRKGCRFLPFSAVRTRIPEDAAMLRYLNPKFLDAIAEAVSED